MESMITFLPCINLEETKEFYEKVVGLEFYMDQGGCYIFDSGKGYLGFTCNPSKVAYNKPCISFNLKNELEVDQMYQRLEKIGVAGLTQPQKHPLFPVYSFFFLDPNGYTLEFQKITMTKKKEYQLKQL